MVSQASVSSGLSQAASPRKKKKLYGKREPRVFTPPLRELTPETSLGILAVEVAEQMCGMDLYPWQEILHIHGLQLAGGLTVSTMHDQAAVAPFFRSRDVVDRKSTRLNSS